ncbi:uncharacterized protein LOC105391838 [Plutella xylostella]|uniref:uncharacterized protein LOC105391838 n=1 Tax=Plutella xylostella TaxID=51655 RepID=UPI002032DE07|nr:uncharacterized protein LOC105391838 [Plutella xylostella]
MFAAILLGLVVSVAAAPHRAAPEYGRLSDYVYDDNVFDTHKFWSELEASLLLEQILEDFYKHFPSRVDIAGVRGHEYQVLITIPDYEEKDIVVKARTGVLMVEATRAAGSDLHHYLDVRSLPAAVDPAGKWNYNEGVLNITFPLRGPVETSSEELGTAAPATAAPRDREEMEPAGEATDDADVGLDQDKVQDIDTNEIKQSSVEATTYAVDMNNEIEFVPVSLK